MSIPHPIPDPLVELIARRFRAMGEPMRIRLLDRLREGEATVAELTEALGASQQNVSKHLAVLAEAGILARRKDGNRVHYRIGDESVLAICEEVCGSVQRQLDELQQILVRCRPVTAVAVPAVPPPPEVVHAAANIGPLGRLGRLMATHRRAVAISWLVVVVALGAFAPRVETALSGAGWQASGSQSVQARDLIQANFGGQSSNALMVVLHSPTQTVGSPAFAGAVTKSTAILRSDPRVASILPPTRGTLDLEGRPHRDHSRGRRRRSDRDGAGRRRTQGQAHARRRQRRRRLPDRRLGDVVGLQHRQPQRDDEVRALLLAGHARDPRARLRRAGRGGAAADADDRRPGRRGRLALHRLAGRRGLDLGDELRAHVRARARHRLRALHRQPLPRRPLRLHGSTRSTPSPSPWTPPAKPCSSPARPCSSRSRR